MRENLIPEQRTDKNGVTSVRWVKPAGSDTGTGSSLPAPVLTSAPAIDYAGELKSMLQSAADEYGDNHTRFLAKASSDTLAYVHEALTAGDKPDHFIGDISCLMDDNAEDHIVEAFIHLYDTHDLTLDDMEAVDLLRGALESGTNPPAGYDRYDTERATAVRSLYTFLYQAGVDNFGTIHEVKGQQNNGLPASSYRFKNPILADYISSHPEQTDMLINIATDHPEWLQPGAFNSATELPDIFREYLDTTAPLQRGVL